MTTSYQTKLRSLGNPQIAQHSQGFFKTGVGEYGEGDLFLGIRVPVLRKFSKELYSISQEEIQSFLDSKYHEERMVGLLILVNQYTTANGAAGQDKAYQFYLKNFPRINNWDLVDMSCPAVIGHYLFSKDRSLLDQWALSERLWTRRIAIISTLYFIRQSELHDTFRLAHCLLFDKEDLIHKAVGWMLREAGKRDNKQLTDFLDLSYAQMPRTMLRYAIEKQPEPVRQQYLKGRR